MWLDSPVNARLSAQKALLSRITPEIRMVTIASGDGRALLRVYHDGPLSPDAEEEFDDATAEIMADIPNADWEGWPSGSAPVTVEFVRRDSPARLESEGWLVYHRKETAGAG